MKFNLMPEQKKTKEDSFQWDVVIKIIPSTCHTHKGIRLYGSVCASAI